MKEFVVSTSQEIVLEDAGEYRVVLAREGVEVKVRGRFCVAGIAQESVSVIIHHQAPRTVAHTSLRGTSADQGKLSIFGRIVIDPKCPASNSFLEERILLLSPHARGEAVPELEILTDDVKCSHAASLSMVDSAQLFYLQSRGLSTLSAEQLLVDSFLA